MPKRTRSLKTGILVSLIIPLILFVIADTVLSYVMTMHYVDKIYDRWLLDSARALAQEIKTKDDKVLVELPPAAQEIVKWDDTDKTFFNISSTAKGLLAGDDIIPKPAKSTNWSSPVFSDSKIRGEVVRIVSMRLTKPESDDTFFIQVAETINKRREMMHDILLADLLSQVGLIILVSLYLLSGLKRGLQPLLMLADEIGKRSPRDLRPIEESHVFSEVKTLTDTINDLLDRLAQAITAQQRFIANAAHQLRTPLAGFVLQAERMAREDDILLMRPALYQMQQSANRLSHTVNQLLVLAKSEPIDGMNELKPVDLYQVVRATCMEWAPKALQGDIELSFESPEQPMLILGDETLLQELLANLLDNAISYGRQHGNIIVKLTPQPKPTLIVEDDGPGIQAHEKAKVFERFYRIPGSIGNGCGLGLPIVKEIADLHHARLELTQKSPQGGTRIIVAFS